MKKFDLVHSLGALGLVVTALAATANAADPAAGRDVVREVRTTSVHYTPADLATEQAVQALYERLERASRQVCRRDGDRSAAAVADARECRRRSLDAAVALVKDPQLTGLHGERCRVPVSAAIVAAVSSEPRGR